MTKKLFTKFKNYLAMSDFQQTVDLSKKLNPQPPKKETPAPDRFPMRKKVFQSHAKDIDEVFGADADEKEEQPVRNKMHQIYQPVRSRFEGDIYKKATVVLSLLLVLSIGYFLFFNNHEAVKVETGSQANSGWYSVKLLSNETYYGQIADLSSDPVLITNVYYDYDQINAASSTAKTKPETASIRLVKRGNETHGPDGALSVVRAQVVYMEALKADSKVLKAILEYQK
jgi:hypothetical protein